jgi:tRNA G37 N-methylase Trm5
MQMRSDDLSCHLPEQELDRLSRSVTVIGDIAILSLPPDGDVHLEDIADAIMARRERIRTVLNKTTRLEGDRRVARYSLLAGGRTVTVHREYGFSYTLDVSEAFFNPRLAYELPGMLSTSFDRAVFPTPLRMDGMLYRLAPMVRQGGMIHFYTFKKRHQIPGLAREFAQEGYDVVTTRR